MRVSVLYIGILASGLALLLAGCGSPTPPPVAPTSEPTAMAEVTATSEPTPTIEATATSEPTPTIEATATSEPTSRAEATATAAPSAAPTVLPTETPLPTEGSQGQANADVVQVRAVQDTDGPWTFHVTVEHPDTGWEDYADGWDVVTSDGIVLKPDPDSQFTRTLLHPHENEQPFTRSQSGIEIPEGVTEVRVRAHDLVDGFGGQEVVVDLTAESGPDFEVVRE
jgi:cytoskeletal protein RodZ